MAICFMASPHKRRIQNAPVASQKQGTVNPSELSRMMPEARVPCYMQKRQRLSSYLTCQCCMSEAQNTLWCGCRCVSI